MFTSRSTASKQLRKPKWPETRRPVTNGHAYVTAPGRGTMTIVLEEHRGRSVSTGRCGRSKFDALTGSLVVTCCWKIAICIILMVPARAQSALPGEFPFHPFRSPFPHQTAAAGDELREKYLFGDWFGYRSELAAHGIKPSLLLIVDPFANVRGGLRRGVTNYDLLCLDVLVDSNELLALAGGQLH